MQILPYFEWVNAPLAPKKNIGKLHISTGRVVACDPLVEPDTPALERRTPTGDFVVELYLSNRHEPCLACLRFSANTVTRWELATIEGQNPQANKGERISGYGVCVEWGCFMDSEGANALLAHENSVADNCGADYLGYYEHVLEAAMAQTGDYQALDFRPYADNPHNIIIFSASGGDGWYSSYWGFDAEDNLVCLVTDLGMDL